jgi:hypothetical protein
MSLTGNNLSGFCSTFLEASIMTIGTFFVAGFFVTLGGLSAWGAVQVASILLGALGDVIGKHVS